MIRPDLSCKKFFLAVVLSFLTFTLFAADRYSVASGNWNSTTTWSANSGGASGASVPGKNDDVYIENGHTVTVTEDYECLSVTFTGAIATLVINSPATLTVRNSVTLNKLTSTNSECNLTGSGTLTCVDVFVGSSINPPPSDFFSSLYTHTFKSSIANLNISVKGSPRNNLTINSYIGGTSHFRNGIFNLEKGIVTIEGEIITNNPNAGNISTLSMAKGAQSGTLILKGKSLPFNLSGTGINTINLNGSASLVNYSMLGAQTALGTSYNNITLSGSGAKTITGITVNGTLSMEGTATSAGTTPAYGINSVLQYKGSAAQITGVEFPSTFSGTGGVIINNLTGVTLSASVTVNGSLALIAGPFSVGANTLTFQNSNSPIIRTSGTISTSSDSNLSFGSPGNTAGADFMIPAGLFTAAPVINNLSIYRTNNLTLNDQVLSLRGILLCNGPLNTNGNLNLISTAAQTALIDGSGTGNITGNVTMQRYLPSGFGYKYFSSPFQVVTVNEFSDDMDLLASFPTFYQYDEARTTSGWVSYNNPAGILSPLKGYAINFGSSSLPNTTDITGTVNNGYLSTTLYNHNNSYTLGFNLVGNPYPSPINWDAASGWTKTNIDDALYYFKASAIDEYGGTYSTYVNKVSSDGLATAIIPSMQGFFIHVSNGSYPVTGTLGLNNNVRITDLTHSFLKSGEKGTVQLIRLCAAYIDDTTAADPTVIYFDEKAGSGFDKDLDALKLMNTDFLVPNFYSFGTDGSKLSINALPDSSELLQIPLGLKLNLDGFIVFRISYLNEELAGYKVSISDKVTGKEQDLTGSGKYEVFLMSGDYTNRFFLNLSVSATGISDPVYEDLFSAYSSHGIIKMNIGLNVQKKNILTISSLTGQILLIKKDLGTGYHELNPGLKDGFCIVTFSSGNFRRSKKIMIQNR